VVVVVGRLNRCGYGLRFGEVRWEEGKLGTGRIGVNVRCLRRMDARKVNLEILIC
jgi:hypothetical protein